MGPGNKYLWLPFLPKITDYLMGLKNLQGQKVVFTQKKTGFFGMISNVYSLEKIFSQNVENGDLKYLSTFKFREGAILFHLSLLDFKP